MRHTQIVGQLGPGHSNLPEDAAMEAGYGTVGNYNVPQLGSTTSLQAWTNTQDGA